VRATIPAQLWGEVVKPRIVLDVDDIKVILISYR